jgi:putative pyruvate formate lyase activating enzyme
MTKGKSIVNHHFPNYSEILKGDRLAKYLIAKKVNVDITKEEDFTLKQLWEFHDTAKRNFQELNIKYGNKPSEFQDLPRPNCSYLDLKRLIAFKIVEKCHFCERRCGINRNNNQVGFCKLNSKSIVNASFLHIGEEPPLVPSGTIFFSGCTFSCEFCQNWRISQHWGTIEAPIEGNIVSSNMLTKIMKKLFENGARNINWVGGEPTPNIHTILAALCDTDVNIIQLWNSNMYTSKEVMELLYDIIDFWLPDLKFHSNEFAYKMTQASNYWEIVTNNIKSAYQKSSTEMIIRHLLMPGRILEDTIPILEWCAENVKLAFVNIMSQWRPEYKIFLNLEHASLNRRIKMEELEQARNFADKLQIKWKEVS